MSVEDFAVEADACDAIAIEINAGADFECKALVIAEGLCGGELPVYVKGEERGCGAVSEIELKA